MADDPLRAVDVLLGLAVLAGAVAAVAPRRRTGATVAFLVFGLLLVVLWTRLGAPDVALAEAAIGTGVTGALFVDTVTRGRPVPEEGPRGSRRLTATAVLGLLTGTLLGAGLAVVLVRSLVGGGTGLTERVRERMDESGVDHPVTAVLLNFRSYDTLLEIAVLLVAVLAVAVTLGSGAERAGRPAAAGRPDTLVWFCRVVSPVLLLIAAWVLFAGVDRPGGAFQAGAVLAGALILMNTAGIGPAPWHGVVLRGALVVGLVAFLAAAVWGPATGGAWLALDPAWAGWVIVAVETTLALSIGTSLTVVFLALGRGRVVVR
ncbi:hydrogenase subunit MbhD domain-containing protein [Kocuria sp. NPDC057446]|uniref:hydrogenase subunit MbhD domain-containing protein n=1 Tax=Kocuria sp. NPDC057446 TaxID=3346137 RepID=UPI00368BFF0D